MNDIKNLYTQIAAAPLDKDVGIRIASLSGNDDFTLYAAELGPQTKVGAHYHQAGIEIYQIVEGKGAMYTGRPCESGSVDWQEPEGVEKGDCFTVPEGFAHQLFNTHNEPLVVIFGCSNSHLTSDRTLVKGVGE